MLILSPMKYLLVNNVYLARKVSGHVFVCKGYEFCLFLRFFYWILKLSQQCGIFSFSFYYCKKRSNR